MECIKQVVANNCNGQRLVYLPKSMNAQEGDLVKISSYINPVKQKLEGYKEEGKAVQLINAKGEVREGKITGFVGNGVMLSNGKFIDFNWIEHITESIPDCHQEEVEYLPASDIQEVSDKDIDLAEQNRQEELDDIDEAKLKEELEVR